MTTPVDSMATAELIRWPGWSAEAVKPIAYIPLHGDSPNAFATTRRPSPIVSGGDRVSGQRRRRPVLPSERLR